MKRYVSAMATASYVFLGALNASYLLQDVTANQGWWFLCHTLIAFGLCTIAVVRIREERDRD
jgi:hypothetical protein